MVMLAFQEPSPTIFDGDDEINLNFDKYLQGKAKAFATYHFMAYQ